MNDNSTLSLSEQSQISLDELRKKPSVRTTFKLSKETINLPGLIAGQLGIKQKSLLDHLTEDRRSLPKNVCSQQKYTPVYKRSSAKAEDFPRGIGRDFYKEIAASY
ncbi:MAG: hypothetical protein WBB19_02685 [Desulforhopalus sp.]